MKTGKIRERLATLLTDLFKANIPNFNEEWQECQPEDLDVNRGSNQYNDWCSWTGKINHLIHKGYFIQVHSWDTMSDLVRHGKIGIVGDNVDISGSQITRIQ